MAQLPYIRFGRTGLEVSRLCLGTATFGGQCDEATSFAIMDHATDLGITFFDTADKYPIGSDYRFAGVTEELVGRWLVGRRDSVVLATKVHGATGPRPWDEGLSRRHIVSAIDDSLRRLRTDYIDVYQLHRPDLRTPIEETMRVLDDLVRAGKVRYIGCSNFLAYQIARAIGKSEANRLVSFSSVQPRYNLLFRQYERELFPLCVEENLAVLPYNLLAGGLLTGKHPRVSPPKVGTRFADVGAGALYQQRYWNDSSFDTVEKLGSLAAEAGLTLPALATAWVLSRPAVTSAVLGATKPEQLDVPVGAVSIELGDELTARLDDLTKQFRYGDSEQ